MIWYVLFSLIPTCLAIYRPSTSRCTASSSLSFAHSFAAVYFTRLNQAHQFACDCNPSSAVHSLYYTDASQEAPSTYSCPWHYEETCHKYRYRVPNPYWTQAWPSGRYRRTIVVTLVFWLQLTHWLLSQPGCRLRSEHRRTVEGFGCPRATAQKCSQESASATYPFGLIVPYNPSIFRLTTEW